MDRKVRTKTRNKQRHQWRKEKTLRPSEERKIMFPLWRVVPKQQPQPGLPKKKLILQELRQAGTYSSGLRNTKNNKAKHQKYNKPHFHKEPRWRRHNWLWLWLMHTPTTFNQQHKSISQTSTFITHLQTSSNKQQYDQHKNNRIRNYNKHYNYKQRTFALMYQANKHQHQKKWNAEQTLPTA